MKKSFAILFCLCVSLSVLAAVPDEASPSKSQKKTHTQTINDFNTPLHLMSPDYQMPYVIPTEESVQDVLNRVLSFLEASTPCCVVDGKTGLAVTDYSKIDENSRLQRGAFRLTSYEWGVTYAGMLAAGRSLGDERFTNYTLDRFRFLAEVIPYFQQAVEKGAPMDGQLRQVLQPAALDDCGAMCVAMIKSVPLMRVAGMTAPASDSRFGSDPAPGSDRQLAAQATLERRGYAYNGGILQPYIDNYMNYIMKGQFRLKDGTLARNRPMRNSVWLDDMFMSLPAMAQIGGLTRDNSYFEEACRQYRLFVEKMFVPEINLFRHGWVQSMSSHPSFHWARANGWALMTTVEILDVLPTDHFQRPFILETLEKHVRGLQACQSSEGFWHQLLDRNDSYLETSATAIYCYSIAKAINRGWLDAQTYGPMVLLAWNAVQSKVTDEGHVEGTCVGTGMAFDPAFYYYRPVNDYAAHGYGPVLLAGAEVIELLRNTHPKMNDSALLFYPYAIQSDSPIFEDVPANRKAPAAAAGSSRKSGRPVVFVIGDSTVKNGRGDGSNGLWGWGAFLQDYLYADSVTVENFAIGGRSSRTFIEEGRWDQVLEALLPGDIVLIQFGHNDGGRFGDSRNRFTLRGVGEETETYPIGPGGANLDVHTFGWYMRKYLQETVDKGATPIACSLIPRAMWRDGKTIRGNDSYALWTRQAVDAVPGSYFIDLNNLVADKYDVLGMEYVDKMFPADHTHTDMAGAKLNAATVAENIKKMPISAASYVKAVIQK